MHELTEHTIHCPYCGEAITILVTSEDEGAQYIEDCQVCCRPITLAINASASGEIMVSAYAENDVF